MEGAEEEVAGRGGEPGEEADLMSRLPWRAAHGNHTVVSVETIVMNSNNKTLGPRANLLNELPAVVDVFILPALVLEVEAHVPGHVVGVVVEVRVAHAAGAEGADAWRARPWI